ncbi:mitochondrial intermediate peptidase isoform X1 [Nomia melanderi]|uniref:mitochondrial intermediate peptidase isoform X1 n=1 Tax=Nomia melanderi TaxID=2448451 RepID=UPI0013041ACB|nr:mitochondrial intermediate peptidase isoform X1 [Nomia melanderi]XP_031839139.1 mitochondrial intermediate peptidase isoform X1 [Nomia melanderi]XP_031839147.1 mitochondrial intermediate peptidase isoform X1 [Nomia melanderi]XP_031839154.1 mitochondrial intermediate peptidase isoform X1 [Nomia melanderi]XP_031839163.1 mitochondrial intermediate peptidase isoform X1 [Nomia melanderi]XP_031839174.1 mitochondrial intermediate peptidase isoform X1 [Nomia melanderi]XP_031839185.1 mitochondrial 
MMHTLRKQFIRHVKTYRSVNTWSPLATAFNSITKHKHDPWFSKKESGLFGIPELKSAQGFNILKDQAMCQTNMLIEEATSPNRKRKMVEIFDEMSNVLCKVADLAEFIRLAHPDTEFIMAAEDACIFISGIVEKLNTHRDLYNALKQVSHNGDILATSDVDNHVAKLFLFDFEQSGIHLPEAERQTVVKLNDYILQVGQKFMAGIGNSRPVSTSILPDDLKKHFIVLGNKVITPGLHVDSPNSVVREAAYRIFLYPDKEQEYLLQELLNSRHELARLCGFSSYAHRAVKGSTVETPEVIFDFLNILNDNLKLKAVQDFQEMQQMKDAETNMTEKVMQWDTAYFLAQAKRTWLNMSNAEFIPYFSLGACMDGINTLTQALYGIRLESTEILSGEVWADNIQKLAVIDENNSVLGYIYCDFFERKGKPNQDCHFTIRGGKQLSDGTYQNPIAVLMLSLPAPGWGFPCLLSPVSVENLFHEMGHALHSMLGRTKYQHVAGTRCSTDFAEVPSILMEYFASDPRVVCTFARHFQTGEQIPANLVEKLHASRNIFCASELQNQVCYSMLDQVYHSGKLEKSTTTILKEIQGKYFGLPYVENTAWHLRFSHLVGYGAKYYAYLISRAIAWWIWQTYFQADPFNRTAGDRYRNECLAHGGGKPSSKLVSDFLNKEASASNFAKSLLNEIDIKTEQVRKVRR